MIPQRTLHVSLDILALAGAPQCSDDVADATERPDAASRSMTAAKHDTSTVQTQP
jgi:hypothetical protein